MSSYAEEILDGLDLIPVPEAPAILVVTGNEAEPILTGKKSGETILVGASYGNGRILIAAHDCYFDWLNERNDRNIVKLMNNIKYWLTGDDRVMNDEIADITQVNNRFNDYKIIKWSFEQSLNRHEQQNLLKFIENGGGLLCAGTIWHIQSKTPSKKLSDYDAFKFIKDTTGVLFKSNCLTLPKTIKAHENKAHVSNFQKAVDTFDDEVEIVDDDYFGTLEHGLDVVTEEGIITPEKVENIKNKLIDTSNNTGTNAIPSKESPLKNEKELELCRVLGKCYIFCDNDKAPGIEEFPGDFDEEPDENILAYDVDFEFKTKFAERLSTGFYLPAGFPITVKVLSGNPNGWSVRIGAHCDDLAECKELKRWHVLTVVKSLSTKKITFNCPFGGLVYLESSGPGSINVSISNVVESPFIDLTDEETIDDWSRRVEASGLWAELAGEHVIFTTPSDCIRHLTDPDEVVKIIKYWDTVIELHHQLRGTNPKDFKRERIVNDVQPSVGYMHSGYPIVTELDICQPDHEECIFNLEKLNSVGNWGLFHEIGHNLQRDEWDFEGCEEVTCNFFSMHAMKHILGQDVTEMKWINDQENQFSPFFARPTYSKWKENPAMGLIMFAQLIKHFGWDPLYQFLKDYEYDIKRKSNLPTNNQEKIDQWVIRYSNLVKRNIKPHFEMYGIPVSSEVDRYVDRYSFWSVPEEKNPNVFFRG